MRRKKAIVFDDEANILAMLERLMSRMDYDLLMYSEPVVCPVYGDDENICAASYPCADVIISDYRLPRMTGLELFRRQLQRGCKLTRKNRAIMSGYLSQSELEEIREMDIAFFAKPFHLSRLTEWLKTCEERIDLSQPLGARRREARRPVEIPIYYLFSSSGKVCQAVVTDISESGFCMRGMMPLEREQLITVTTPLPNSCLNASVRWVAKQEGGQFIAGLHRV